MYKIVQSWQQYFSNNVKPPRRAVSYTHLDVYKRQHPQTLRVYESKGLVNPQRSGGNTRLYSRADIERLELINQLTDEGINLAGVVRILDMKERAEERERENEKLRARVRQLEDELHEYKMQKKITALAPRDGSVNPEQVMRKLLGAGGDL